MGMVARAGDSMAFGPTTLDSRFRGNDDIFRGSLSANDDIFGGSLSANDNICLCSLSANDDICAGSLLDSHFCGNDE